MKSGCLNTTSLDARNLDSGMNIVSPMVDQDPQIADIPSNIDAARRSYIRENALNLLRQGDLVKARREYIAKTVYGNEHVIDALTYICNSTYLGPKYVIHANIIDESKAGKSTIAAKSLDLMPPEDVISLPEISSMHVCCISKDIDLSNKIICLDNLRDKNVPVLKIYRNNSGIGCSYVTVIDADALFIEIIGRPAVIASSFKPLKDLENQAINRFLPIKIDKLSKVLDKKIHAKRHNISKRSIWASSGQYENKLILQEASRILRDEGIREFIVPFDVELPEESSNWARAQLSRLIEISAFIHQFERRTIQMGNRKFILAVKEDLEAALDIWHELGLAGGR
jgi:hypothetical protein